MKSLFFVSHIKSLFFAGMDSKTFHVAQGEKIRRSESREPVELNSPVRTSGSVSERSLNFPAECAFGSDSGGLDLRRDKVAGRAGSTVSEWAKNRKFCCCGSVAHLWAWTIGFVSLVTSGVIIYVELKHA